MCFFTLSLSKAGRKGLKKGIHSCTMEHFTCERAQLFKHRILLAPVVQMLDSTNQQISIRETNCGIQWIEITELSRR